MSVFIPQTKFIINFFLTFMFGMLINRQIYGLIKVLFMRIFLELSQDAFRIFILFNVSSRYAETFFVLWIADEIFLPWLF
jgi:hypothetical protein